jgi:hypothetical protein
VESETTPNPALDSARAELRDIATNQQNPRHAGYHRGDSQVSAYIDAVIASFLPTGAVTGLANAQLLYTLPVSLFGISISAAELPAMAGALGADPTGAETVRRGSGRAHDRRATRNQPHPEYAQGAQPWPGAL